MANIKTNIINNINSIRETISNNNKFLIDIDMSVDELKEVVEKLIKYCKQAKQDLSIQINTVGEGNQKIQDLETKANRLGEKVAVLESELNTLIANSNIDKTSKNDALNEEIKRLNDQLNNVTAERDNINAEKTNVTNERNNALKNIENLNNDLYEINSHIENLKKTVNNPDVNALYGKILEKIKGIQAIITNFYESKDVPGPGPRSVGGTRKSHIATKKMKRFMRGGYIADYFAPLKKKTHHKSRKEKKRTSSQRKKRRYSTTTTSRSSRRSTSTGSSSAY
jgi:chromosome segregation ATPase